MWSEAIQLQDIHYYGKEYLDSWMQRWRMTQKEIERREITAVEMDSLRRSCRFLRNNRIKSELMRQLRKTFREDSYFGMNM